VPRCLRTSHRTPSRDADALRVADTPVHVAPVQVVGPATDTHVTIRIKASGVTYPSDIFRLRHMVPEEHTPAPAEAEAVVKAAKKSRVDAAAAADGVEDALGAGVKLNGTPVEALQSLVAAKYPNLSDVRVNPPAAAPRGPLFTRFAAALEATKETHTVDFMLHGTAEANIDSILKTSLRGRPGCNQRWLTSCVSTATGYAKGASRMVIFAVLKPKVYANANIHISTDDAHQLPLFVARCASAY
jgi:hypothetical protein